VAVSGNQSLSGCVTTLQGCLVNKSSGGTYAILGKTLSRADLVFGCLFCEKCSATQGDSLAALLKGLILKWEIEDREERRRRIGLQYCESRTL